MGVRVEVLRPTRFLAEGGDGREGFEAVWSRIPMRPTGWRWNGMRTLGDERLFVKANRFGLAAKPKRWGRRWDIEREVAAWRALRGADLPLVEPLAWGVERRLGLPVRSFLVTAWVEDGLDLEQWLRRRGEAVGPARRRQVLQAAGGVVAALHALGWVHGDMAIRNLLVRGQDDGGEILLLDLARTRRADPRGLGALTDLYRLAKTAIKAGASPEEAAALLGPAAGDRATEIVRRTREIRAIRSRLRRKARHWAWFRLGV